MLVVNDSGKLQNIQIKRDMAGNHLMKNGTTFKTIDDLINSLMEGSKTPLLSKHPDSPGAPLYLRAGRTAASSLDDDADA